MFKNVSPRQTWGQFHFVNSNSTLFHLVNSNSNLSIPIPDCNCKYPKVSARIAGTTYPTGYLFTALAVAQNHQWYDISRDYHINIVHDRRITIDSYSELLAAACKPRPHTSIVHLYAHPTFDAPLWYHVGDKSVIHFIKTIFPPKFQFYLH